MSRRRIPASLLLLGFLATSVPGSSEAVERLLGGSLSKTGTKFSASVPVVHHVSLWRHQDDFAVTDLRVVEREAMRESKPEATIYLHIEGTLRKGRRIKHLFVREQLREVANGKRIVEVIVVPVVEAETLRAKDPEESDVAVTAEYTLHQFQWPDNDFVIVCGRHVREVSYRYP